MFDLKTVPKIVIKEMSYKDIDILREANSPKTLRLFNKGVRQMVLNQFTNREIKELYSQYDMAYGDVLLTGFGYGIAANWIASKPEVTSVTVLEIEKDVYDIYLLNNILNPKVNVIIADASTYKTDKHYDCLFLDHYEHHIPEWVFRDMRRIADNIPNHDVFWAWSLELKFAEVAYGLDSNALHATLLRHNYIDFYLKYDFFKGAVLGLLTLPDLTHEKINEYVYTYFDCLGYSTSL